MKLITRISAALAVALALAVGGAGTAIAKHGADDPPGHHQGEHHGERHHHGKHHQGQHHQGHGADDGPNHT
jgi:Spy/CpxP family protein refolding chaperone